LRTAFRPTSVLDLVVTHWPVESTAGAAQERQAVEAAAEQVRQDASQARQSEPATDWKKPGAVQAEQEELAVRNRPAVQEVQVVAVPEQVRQFALQE
jgi:RES domain-containing protein